MKNRKSDKLKVTCGVPQGCVLGPLLSLLCINDLNSCLKHSQYISFADDTKIFNQSPSLIFELDFDKKEMVKWLRKNLLTLKKSKCMLLEFGKKNIEPVVDGRLSIGRQS